MRTGIKAGIYEAWKKHRAVIIMCLIAAAACSVYAGLLANTTLSPAEGWYSYYAYLMNEEGAIPYLDFELLFPPLYVYIIALFTRVFGYGLLPLRILGVILYALTGVFACLIFEKLTKKPWLGLLGGILTVSVLQSEVVQIFYDYIRFLDLSVYVAIYFFLRYLDSRDLSGEKLKPRFSANVIIGTVFAVFASMYKQSSGLIFLLFCIICFVFLFICLPQKRELGLQIGTMLGVTAVMYGIMCALLATQGSLGAYFRYNFVSSVDSKGGGSILSILFGWIPRSVSSIIGGVVAAILVALLLFACIYLSRKYKDEDEELCPKFLKILHIAIPAALAIIVILPFIFSAYAIFMEKTVESISMYMAFMFTTLFFAVSAFMVIFRKWVRLDDWQRHYKYVFLTGSIFVLAYSVCTSGGLAESQAALGYAFIPVVLAVSSRYRKKEIAVGVLCAAMLFQTGAAFARKVNTTYGWWGLSTHPYYEQTETCNVPIFKGIKMTSAYAQMYNDVYYSVVENTEEGEEIFVFPHMPILYVATERPRATETAIQWFDVATDEARKAAQSNGTLLCERIRNVRTRGKLPWRRGKRTSTDAGFSLRIR